MRMWIPFHRMLVTRKLVICSNQHASNQHASYPIGIRVARKKVVKDWSVKCQIQTMVFSIICPCPCAHTQHCKRYPLCSSEQMWGLLGTCMRQDAWLRCHLTTRTRYWVVKLRSSTFWRRILFLSVVIKKRTIEHENSVSQRSLHSLTVLIDFDNRRDLTYLYVTYRHDIFVRFSRSDPLEAVERLFKYSCREASIEYSKLHCERTSLLEASLRAYS